MAKKTAPAQPKLAPVTKPKAQKPKAADPAPATARRSVPEDVKITVLAKENPRREATLAARTFAQYKTGQTVGEFRAACKANKCDANYIHADIAAGYIKVS